MHRECITLSHRAIHKLVAVLSAAQTQSSPQDGHTAVHLTRSGVERVGDNRTRCTCTYWGRCRRPQPQLEPIAQLCPVPQVHSADTREGWGGGMQIELDLDTGAAPAPPQRPSERFAVIDTGLWECKSCQ
jgi:hypothetical protein